MAEIFREQEEVQPEQSVELSEEQSVWKTIKQMQEGSEFKRSDGISANCEIESEGKKFRIEVIEDGKDPALSEVQELLEKTFSEEEVDSEEILRSSVDGVTPWDTEDTNYRIVTVRDEKGKLVSVFGGAPLDCQNEKGEPTGEQVYYVGYAASARGSRKKGLAREAYISALIDATKRAGEESKQLKFAMGECTHTSEKFWNNVGWKRIYAQTGDKKQYTELPYIQPALDFDEKTGEIAEGASECPEHLMIDSFGRMPPSKEDVKGAYDSMLHFCADWPEEAFENPQAFEVNKKYMAGVRAEFHEFLDKTDKLIYLDAENRKKAKKTGVKIRNHTDADRRDAGKEDF
ncbi:MAG: hypothetical protein A2402_00715 [Candidatus Staskawiczbacteria bacterium RIFOXYC1_FULL_37_43]|nr:MAG: hypothetical protein A2813_01605 [Candidatus Staskawiczbacteria bacterium RIFCSPHIGHO2_01_FULL_37_17]OGZ71464.1 MAG: hypothetical protein A2891_00950 [Candidatus Staskawiczbacteria bacterium RIFCSPLOWO2_01_FULL_37_19]OGZ76143.1 MAG: hypothetical protein A2205_03785 [Candidatus Staskawiczbacteria bacterium RIFOXYA1_FULL_37_15]OGZ80111.1 MAG: hypothetical protein A2353_02505 [Candidatus Staskawiczbacteria bacterium RIFOXYB1_FULL_38_37]OGZ81749.1 MAG: hypothetical protein A2402_00715 [Cand